MMMIQRTPISFCVLALIVLFCLYCPFTKVEESFNLQATHDLLIYGPLDLPRFDHFEFPGVVPRTFVGPVVLASLTAPFAWALQFLGLTGAEGDVLFFPKRLLQTSPHLTLLLQSDPTPAARQARTSLLWLQLLVRLMLGFVVWLCWARLKWTIDKMCSAQVGRYFVLVTCCQFHFLFYASRTLPNTFALAGVLLAFSFWLDKPSSWPACVFCFSFVIIAFRSEVAVYFAPILLLALLTEHKFFPTILIGIVSSVIALIIVVPIDSHFWQLPMWAEAYVFYYNTILNKSSAWGVSPYHWYFTSALPRALNVFYIIAVCGFWYVWRDAKRVVVPTVAFLGLYSFLPHKELRFIFYVLPIFSFVAALVLEKLQNQMKFFKVFLVGVCVIGAVTNFGLLHISSLNYAGGNALEHFNSKIAPKSEFQLPLRVHIDTLAAVSGVSRFGEIHNSDYVQYFKTENLNLTDLAGRFDYLISEHQQVPGFSLMYEQIAFSRVELHPETKIPQIKLEPKLFVHKKSSK